MGTTVAKVETHPAILKASVMQIKVDVAQVGVTTITQAFLEDVGVIWRSSLSRKTDDVGLTTQVEAGLVRTWRDLDAFAHLVLFTIPEVILNGLTSTIYPQ